MDQFSEEQIEEFKEAFAVFDKDKNGVITIQELETALKLQGQNPTLQELEDIIKEIDPNGNGQIDFQEFVQIVNIKMRKDISTQQKQLIEAFKVFDRDNDGLMSEYDLKHFMTSIGEKLTDEEFDDMIKQAKFDERGQINEQEFIRFMLN